MKRRHFVGYFAGGVGVLAVGWAVLPPRQRLTPDNPLPVNPGQVALNGWVKVSPDDTITVVMNQSELGQGIHTSLAMLLADEMDAAWDKVTLEQSTLDKIYNNQAEIMDALPFQQDDNGLGRRIARRMVGKIIREVPGLLGTGGSSSVTDLWLPMRQAGASARAALIAAAADTWKVPALECRAESGRVTHSSGKSASFGELAGRAAQMGVPRNVALKDPSAFKMIGKEMHRLDNTAKANGSAVYSLDVTPPGLVYASVAMCPTMGGKVTSFDASAVLKMPGVKKVVKVEPYAGGLASYGAGTGGVAAIADTPWRAMKAADAMREKITWDHGPAKGLGIRGVMAGQVQALDAGKGKKQLDTGDVEAALKGAVKTILAEYNVPFLAHATMEPMNATVKFKDGAATLWAPAQGPALAVNAVAGVLGIKANKVKLMIPPLGGGFGRRTFVDVVSQAAAVAKETDGAPVQVFWKREEDMMHDYYRPAFTSRHKAGFDAQGKLVAWEAATAGSSMGAPSFADGSSKGAFDTGYGFPNARVTHTAVESLVPTGIWRSVGHSHNAFFTESFMDEAAAAAGKDPVEFRAGLLAEKPRLLKVLKRAAELAEWGKAPAPGPGGEKTARGIAVHPCFGSNIASVAEVYLDDEQKIRVNRVVCVVDCGFALNPNMIRQQLEGGMIFGLSAALQGHITVENGQVQQQNFPDYPPLRMRECPKVVTEIIASTESPGGIGETGVPTIAPAVANAVFALTGKRLRSLPLKLA